MTWQVASLALLAVVVAGGIAWYDRSRPPARVLALVAALAALAVVGRLAFAAIPNVKPTTDIVLFAGYALGAVPGFAVGTVTACRTCSSRRGRGRSGDGRLGRRRRGRWAARAPCAHASPAGARLRLWRRGTCVRRLDGRLRLDLRRPPGPRVLSRRVRELAALQPRPRARQRRVLPPDRAGVRAFLRRYRRRFEVRWPAPAGAAAAALGALALCGGGRGRGRRVRATGDGAGGDRGRLHAERAGCRLPAARAESRRGFGAARGQASSPLYSGWAALGLAAAGRNPRDVRPGGARSSRMYARSPDPRRGRARAHDPRSCGRGGLTATLCRPRSGRRPRDPPRRRLDRRLRELHGFGVLALRAAGAPAETAHSPGSSALRRRTAASASPARQPAIPT